MKYGIVVFPGSNCDHDAMYATAHNAGAVSVPLWHKDTTIPSDVDCIILPGGFSYGDYLRAGAIARFSPIMQEVIRLAHAGKLVVGICNGFQVLAEANLLPGALSRNLSLRFVCKDIYLHTENCDTLFTRAIPEDQRILQMPIAHGEGNYYADTKTLAELEDNNQVVFRYCDAQGNISEEANPNGSLNNIAGIINRQGNVLGMMPHPERACDPVLGSADGLSIFHSIAQNVLSSVV